MCCSAETGREAQAGWWRRDSSRDSRQRQPTADSGRSGGSVRVSAAALCRQLRAVTKARGRACSADRDMDHDGWLCVSNLACA